MLLTYKNLKLTKILNILCKLHLSEVQKYMKNNHKKYSSKDGIK